jgi:hypothetical protein
MIGAIKALLVELGIVSAAVVGPSNGAVRRDTKKPSVQSDILEDGPRKLAF